MAITRGQCLNFRCAYQAMVINIELSPSNEIVSAVRIGVFLQMLLEKAKQIGEEENFIFRLILTKENDDFVAD